MSKSHQKGFQLMPDEYGKNGARETELVLSPGVHAFVLDKTKGNVLVNSGPYKTSLSATDELVTYDAKTSRYVGVTKLSEAITTNVTVPKGSYVILENPAKEGKQPETGRSETLTLGTLRVGQIENIPGPKNFPLWPGQVATVILGHHLRTNQYLMGRVYDDEAARENWDNSVVKASTETLEVKNVTTVNVLGIDKDKLVTGQLIVICGTDVAFYIPPTGVEIIKDETGKYVRDAVTLEVLEYAILVGENGKKTYKRGPDVVVPSPTQEFFTKDGVRKFKAFELQPKNGLHVKVISDYEEDGIKYSSSNPETCELFITGEKQAIYYPREEHAIINYGGSDKIFAVEIPSAGEGRYVLDRLKGNVDLVVGPTVFLPNPIKQVVVRRVLSAAECELYYPGNQEVKDINEELREKSSPSSSLENFSEQSISSYRSMTPSPASMMSPKREYASKGAFADSLKRSNTYTPPRTITLNNKFDGVVRIDIWSGNAITIVNSKGGRRVEIGPKTILLEYDEYLERLSLSRGKPKNTDNRLNTAFLRYTSNPVSDILTLKTSDLVGVKVHVKYLVRFEVLDMDKWFSINNYVQYLVDHQRSLIDKTVRSIGVQEFYFDAANILRNTVLGKSTNEETSVRHFEENGMTIYDLEVINIDIIENDVSQLLSVSRQETLKDSITLERSAAKLRLTQGQQEIERQVIAELAKTQELRDKIIVETTGRQSQLSLTALEIQNKVAVMKVQGEQNTAEIVKTTKALYLESEKAGKDLIQSYLEMEAVREIKVETESAHAQKIKMGAVSPGLVEAITGLANVGMFEKIAEHLAPLSIVRGESLAGTLTQIFAGTPLEGMVDNIASLSKIKTATKN